MGAEPSAGPLARPVRSLSSAAAPGLPPTEPPLPSPRPRAASKLRGAAKAQRGSAGKSKKNPAQKAFSCHYCRQKRADIVTCPKHTEGHRWCGSCVRNHLGLDIEKIRRNKDKIWPDGCAAQPLVEPLRVQQLTRVPADAHAAPRPAPAAIAVYASSRTPHLSRPSSHVGNNVGHSTRAK